jgi:hypothetical protein
MISRLAALVLCVLCVLCATCSAERGPAAELLARLDAAEATLRDVMAEAAGTKLRLTTVEATLRDVVADAEATKAQLRAMEDAGRRRAQRTGGDSEYVRIVTRTTTTMNCPPSMRGGRFDLSRCTDAGYEHCHHEECANGHRRMQMGVSCSADMLARRTREVHKECCDEMGEDCSRGVPGTCNADCAAVFLPFWEDCEATLGADAATFELTVALCQAQLGESLAVQLGVRCNDGTAADECIPDCSAELHGFLLLLNVDGEDSKLSCELHHDIYSWCGAAADGGYLGNDAQLFFSAVLTGAPGVFVGKMSEDAGVYTDLTVRAGQIVTIVGDSAVESHPRWGSCFLGEDTCELLRHNPYVPDSHVNDGVCHDGSPDSCRADCAYGSDAADCHTKDCSAGDLSVQQHGYLSMTRINLDGMLALNMEPGAEMSLTSMAIPTSLLVAAAAGISRQSDGTGRIQLVEVMLSDAPGRGEITGSITVEPAGGRVFDPPGFLNIGYPRFTAQSPCEVTSGGRCVGRPFGFGPNEDCTISVSGGAGPIAPSTMFDMTGTDHVTIAGSRFGHGSLPDGTTLAEGDAIAWHSSGYGQGGNVTGVAADVWAPANDCIETGLCGPLPFSEHGLGGGWEMCFPPTPPMTVVSGNCSLSHDGLCVGRPDGYGPNERCEIQIGYNSQGPNRLGPCGVFDLDLGACNAPGNNLLLGIYDKVTLLRQGDGSRTHFGNSFCPEGVDVSPGDTLLWSSSIDHQGHREHPPDSPSARVIETQGCNVTGLCSDVPSDAGTGLGGGWQVCFEGALPPPPPPPPPATFRVLYGPCKVHYFDKCVGRVDGYGPDEVCHIEAGAGTLGPCPVFDIPGYAFVVTGFGVVHRMEDLVIATGSDTDTDITAFATTTCPDGEELRAGERLVWRSDGEVEGSGWQICFV